MSNLQNEESRTTCPRCRSNSIGPGESQCVNCIKKDAMIAKPKKNEMAAGGIGGFQLPLGAKARRKAIHRCIEMANDISEAHMVVFFNNTTENEQKTFFEALDFLQDEKAADIVREHVVRQTVRSKIAEIVRKKKGGGGYTLYAPNKGKKHNSKPVGTFPTKLAAKRAELARFPPKDAKKLQRIRKEVDRLMKDPKKRADAEKRAQGTVGTDDTGTIFSPKIRKKNKVKKEGFSRDLVESALLSKIIIKDVTRNLIEGLFREDRQGSEWDEFISKISDKAIQGDNGYRRLQSQIENATQASLTQAIKVIQRALGGEAKVKAASSPGKTNDGRTYSPFHIAIEAASIGPIYLYVDKGLPAIEMSDEAKNGLSKVTPGVAKAIRAALAAAQDGLEKVSGVADAVAKRDSYLSKLENNVDKMISGLTPLQISMMKQLLVKKYRGTTK